MSATASFLSQSRGHCTLEQLLTLTTTHTHTCMLVVLARIKSHITTSELSNATLSKVKWK